MKKLIAKIAAAQRTAQETEGCADVRRSLDGLLARLEKRLEKARLPKR
jgi:hypothetical protein